MSVSRHSVFLHAGALPVAQRVGPSGNFA